MLTIADAKDTDSGVYECVAADQEGYEVAVATARLTITPYTVAPTAVISPERLTINQGETTELTCSYTGDPAPTVKWTRSDVYYIPKSLTM